MPGKCKGINLLGGVSMKAIGNLSGKLTSDDMLDLSRLLVKAGYSVCIREKELSKKKVKCIIFGGEDELDGEKNAKAEGN